MYVPEIALYIPTVINAKPSDHVKDASVSAEDRFSVNFLDRPKRIHSRQVRVARTASPGS